VRKSRSLDGIWKFSLAGSDGLSKAGEPLPIYVPSCWEMVPGCENRRGYMIFERDLDLAPGRRHRVVFGAVSHTANVFWNGRPIGHHEDAYTPFEVMIPGGGRSTLAVRVDNSFGDHAGLHISNDYYSYGGLTRPVVIEEVPDVFLSRLHATPRRSAQGWKLLVRVVLARADGAEP